ncbi:MAG TPA: D-cysteine desulfhydrase [Trueperaceae bacterium]|nr:D-cysteine desulfhydrase [Trueperaceae bacterium]HRP47172.1 D-cysteine desulfhydrase [Trueperaceae bacterium]
MQLSRFPRRHYTQGPTPLEPLPRLSAHLGGPNLWLKRDDLLGLAAGGNKTRKLEFLVADALEQGADTLVTTGAVQSNHCRLTLAAAVHEGLSCRLVLEERVPNSYDVQASGNNFLFNLLGVEAVTVVPAGTDLNAAMQVVAGEVAALGRKAYVIPGGGSNPLGALGYVACAQELMQQAFDLGLNVTRLVTASGSGGTHSGVVAGLTGTSAGVPVTGISVRAPKAPQEEKILGLARATAELAGSERLPTAADIEVLDGYVGGGYSIPTPGMVEAVKLFARFEGVLLDPVYSGKAAAGLIDLVRSGAFERHDNVVFLHTGGSPALYAYQDVLVG